MAYTGAGSYLEPTDPTGIQDPAEADPAQVRAAPAEWLRKWWDRFQELSGEIIDLQHRAAELAREMDEAGRPELRQQARDVIERLAELQKLHHYVTSRAERYGEYIGLGGYQLGGIPAVAATALAGLALVVLWMFRSFDAQARKLDMIEDGTLTPEQAAEIQREAGPKPPGAMLAQMGGLMKLALLAGFGWILLDLFRQRGVASNPPLVVYGQNPPRIGRSVHSIRYQHAEDGRYYVHDFDGGVEMVALEDGDVLLSHPRKRLWKDF